MAEYAGFETTLSVLLGAVWTPVGQVGDIDGPGIESEQIEVSHRDSQWRRYVSGMKDGGEISFDVIFDPNHVSHDPTLTDSMYKYAETGVVTSWRVDFPGVGTAVTRAAFDGFVSSFETTSPLEDGLKADVGIKISGAITWTHVP